jgi:hypothetical protein
MAVDEINAFPCQGRHIPRGLIVDHTGAQTVGHEDHDVMGSRRDWSDLSQRRAGGEEAGRDDNLDAHGKPLTI